MTGVEFDALGEYSGTLPTGTTPGKQWKRRIYKDRKPTGRWLMGMFTRELPVPTCCRYHRCIVGVVDSRPCDRVRNDQGQVYDPANPEKWPERPNAQIEFQWYHIVCPDRGIGVPESLPVHLL